MKVVVTSNTTCEKETRRPGGEGMVMRGRGKKQVKEEKITPVGEKRIRKGMQKKKSVRKEGKLKDWKETKKI